MYFTSPVNTEHTVIYVPNAVIKADVYVITLKQLTVEKTIHFL